METKTVTAKTFFGQLAGVVLEQFTATCEEPTKLGVYKNNGEKLVAETDVEAGEYKFLFMTDVVPKQFDETLDRLAKVNDGVISVKFGDTPATLIVGEEDDVYFYLSKENKTIVVSVPKGAIKEPKIRTKSRENIR